MKVLGASLDLVNKKVINVADPSAATDAVNKQFLDAAIRGLDWKQEVVAASTANVNKASPGTTLDGITLAVNDRVLLKDQTAPAENGIYVWIAGASALTRALDADTWAELSGSTVTVQRGTVNADRVYRVTADDGGTLETTAVTFAQVGAGSSPYTAGDGLSLTGQDFNVGAGTGISVDATNVNIDTAVVVRKFAANVGDGAATSIAKAHGLGTADVTVLVKDATSGEVVYPDVTVDATNVTMVFATAPTTNQYRVVVHG